jgi:hypothetical protein
MITRITSKNVSLEVYAIAVKIKKKKKIINFVGIGSIATLLAKFEFIPVSSSNIIS